MHTSFRILITIALSAALTISLPATGTRESDTAREEEVATVSIVHELGTAEVPLSPESTIVFGYDVLDTLDTLGVPVTAVPKATLPLYLGEYGSDEYRDAGTLFEPDFESIFDMRPDVIFISPRQASLYEEFARIAPTVYVAVDTTDYMGSVGENAMMIASLFGEQETAESKLTQLDERTATLRARTDGATALVVMVNDGTLSVFGPGSRFDVAYTTIGFTPADGAIEVSTHGQSISFEYLVEHDPDYLLVLDRGAAISGTGTARTVLDNELVRRTAAFQNDRVVYLSPQAWYLASGGLTATATMLTDIEGALDQAGM